MLPLLATLRIFLCVPVDLRDKKIKNHPDNWVKIGYSSVLSIIHNSTK